MKKHIHAIKGMASGCFSLSEQSGFLWLIDNICHYKLRMEQRCIFDDGIVDIRNHAYRGCIDQQITLCNGISQCSMIIIVEEADLTACFSREILSEFLCAIPVSAGAAGKNMYVMRDMILPVKI